MTKDEFIQNAAVAMVNGMALSANPGNYDYVAKAAANLADSVGRVCEFDEQSEVEILEEISGELISLEDEFMRLNAMVAKGLNDYEDEDDDV